MLLYAVILTPDSNGTIRVECPDVPELHTFGRDREEALKRAGGALEAALSFYVEEGQELPRPSRRGRGMAVVGVSALADAKLQLYAAMRASGIRKAELARRMGISKTNVDRLFDLDRSTRLDLMERAFRALGKRLMMVVEDAA